jgi:hypothetical protein
VPKISARPGVPGLRARIEHAFDEEQKLARALEALGPVVGRSVVLTGGGGRLERDLVALGSEVRPVDRDGLEALGANSTEVLIAAFTGFEGEAGASDFAAAARVTATGGRLLVIHDYARDDASKLLLTPEQRAERIAWSRSDGWFIGHGFKLRVLHCWWTWESIDRARSELETVFGPDGGAMADGMRRPRLEHKVAIYHRSLGAD